MLKPFFALVSLIGLLAAMPARGQAVPAGNDAGSVVTRSALGAWVLKDDPSNPGRNCAVRFLAARKGAAGFALFGPAAGASVSTILFDGPGIPAPRSPQEVRIELVQNGLTPATLRAVQLPGTDSRAGGLLAVSVADLRQTMASMRASESDMKVKLAGSEVLSLDYDGLDAARTAMASCLDGKRFAGKTVREATAEIRPLGTSTISGNAYYKGAALARKQYPPKGSQAVGLIWMTDEFKAWYEQVKREKKLPASIPESILKHFLSTTILDDEGGFRFTNLPAGEFILIANYSYEKNVTERELVGRTDVYVGNQYVGSNDQFAYWSYTVKQGTSYEKAVTIARDGETVQVSLDKSRLFCFLVCR